LSQIVGLRNASHASTLTRTQRLKAGLIAAVGRPAVAVLGRTLTWIIDGRGYYDEVLQAGQQPIMAFWHGRILPATLFWRDRGIVVMTSANFDGEWIARIIAGFGYRSARGSTSRGGSRALVQLRRELATGHPVAFTVDGPRGPARVVQPGAVWLAGATGQSIVPFHIEASHSWTAASWDRSMVPKPFSRVAISIGPPLKVASTEVDVLEDGCSRLRSALAALEGRAITLLEPELSRDR
jgi:lysophospholipid acyltransferase (LPLAT)-like uncharacterized protein